MFSRLLGAGAAFVLIGLSMNAAEAAGGGFTSAQVSAGASTYAARCSQCHGAQLQGGAGPALSGAAFRKSINASYTTAGRLYDFTSKQMPANAPGSLSATQYAGVVAFVLKYNGYPSSGTTLTAQNAGDLKLAGVRVSPQTPGSGISLEIKRAAPPVLHVFGPLPDPASVTISDAMLAGAGDDAGNWLMGGRSFANDRYSPLTQITGDNVATLAPVAIAQTGMTASFEATPVVVNGVMYLSTPVVDSKMKVLALNAVTGARIWESTYNLTPFKICCGPVNRGVAVAYGNVYVLTLDDRLVAFDAANGKVKWETKVADPTTGYSETMTPTIYNGSVIVGSAGGEWAIRGFVASYDAQTGKQRWRWWSTDPKTFSGNSWKSGGGMVWTTPAIDPKLGLVIFSTGNPNPDLSGIGREGDNRYTDSIVALDVATGTLKWFYQEVKHDVWDYDAVSPVVLFDVHVNGTTIPAAGEAGKVGWFFIVDRRTGELIRKSDPYVAMTKNMFSTPTKTGVEMLPGANGGAEWSPAAWSPKTHLAYVLAMDQLMNFATQPPSNAPGQLRLGSAFTNVKVGAVQDGRFVAIDTETGKIAWTVMTDQPLIGGALVTAGNVVFMGEGNGDFDAFDATLGKKLWSYHLGAGVNAPPITYQVDGRQYVAVAAGGNFQLDYPLGDAIAIFRLPSTVGGK
jgi:PQQ-dependent dehydrogenase (methanol/ethanol family)